MIEVNLLPTKKVLSRKEASAGRFLRGAVLVGSLVLFLEVGVFLLFQQLFKRQVAALDARYAQLQSQAEQLSSVAVGLATVQEKARGITFVSSRRFNLAMVISDINRLFPSGMEMTSLQVNSSGAVALTAKAADSASLGRFISEITEQKRKLGKVTLSGLRQDVGSGYSFSLTASYEKD